jgi:hypothetical protein
MRVTFNEACRKVKETMEQRRIHPWFLLLEIDPERFIP